MPTANETRVRVDGLSKSTATARGTPSGAASGSARGGDRSALSRRRGRAPRPARPGEVVVRRKWPESRGGLPDAVSRACRGQGSAATKRVGLGVGEDERRREPEPSGATALTMKPAAQRASQARRPTSAVSTTPSSEPLPRDAADQRVAETLDAGAEPVPELLGALEQAVVAGWCRATRARRPRRPGCRRTWCRARRRPAGRRPRRTRAARRSGRPPPRPLARVTTSGVHARRPGGRTRRRCGRCRSAPRRGRAARRRRRRVARRRPGSRPGRAARRPRPGPARGAPSPVASSTARGPSASASPYGHEPHAAGQRLERLAVGRLAGERERAHRAAVEGRPRAATTSGPAGAPADLERGLVGLGAGVAEEDPTRPARPARAAARPARGRGSCIEEVRDVPERARLRGDRLDERRVGVAEALPRSRRAGRGTRGRRRPRPWRPRRAPAPAAASGSCPS